MNNLEALNFGSKLLKKNKIISYNLDSELLLSNILNLSREKLLINLDKSLNKENYYAYKKLLRRRKENEPIAYILKKKEFWKYCFIVNKNVLIPRPETELIVEQILKMIGFKSSKSILDVGTGSGCIIISILKERKNCNGTAIDISKNALKVAVSNAKMHHLRNKIKFINIDIDKLNHNKYDFVLSTPPSISEIDFKRLEKSVLFEPKIALKAGQDGLSEIKKLILKSKSLLKLNGKLVFEIGFKQEDKIKNFLKENGFYINKICKDIFRNARIIISTNIK